jgi:endonuclease/exonuclease/phosphatase (EEP) superfamily protein YafD
VLSLLALALLSSAGPAAPPAGAVRAMAYNVDFDAKEPARSLDLIEREDPDLVCLTEVTPAFAKEFKQKFANRYSYVRFAPARGTWGLGLASRFPLTDARTFAQRPHRMPAMEARVAIRGRALHVGCVHLFPPGAKRTAGDGLVETMRKNAALRVEQARALVQRFARRDPVLLLGDLNEGPRGDAVRVLGEAGYARACEGPDARCGATFPGDSSKLPAIFEIDHLLGRGLTFQGAHVLRGGGSDHLAVAAAFVIP